MRIAILLVIMTIAVYADLRKRIIPNNLIFFGLITGIYFSVMESQKIYILLSLIVVAILLFFGEGIGHGDQKLISIIPMFLRGSSSMFFIYLGIIYGGYYVYQKRKNISKLPFAPGILVATILVIVTEVL